VLHHRAGLACSDEKLIRALLLTAAWAVSLIIRLSWDLPLQEFPGIRRVLIAKVIAICCEPLVQFGYTKGPNVTLCW
jgi:hypothetical protein